MLNGITLIDILAGTILMTFLGVTLKQCQDISQTISDRSDRDGNAFPSLIFIAATILAASITHYFTTNTSYTPKSIFYGALVAVFTLFLIVGAGTAIKATYNDINAYKTH